MTVPQPHVEEALRAKETELLAEMDLLTRPQQDLGAISFGKRVGDGTSMAVDRLSAVTAHDNLAAILEQVRRALAKLEDGSYGRCDACGAAIGEGRMEARPWAVRCLEHS